MEVRRKWKLKLVQRGKDSFPDEILEMKLKPSVIGREDGHFIIRKDNYLSSMHFAVWIDEKTDCLTIRDLNSTNGTFVENKRVVPHINVTVEHGEYIRAGQCLFQVIS